MKETSLRILAKDIKTHIGKQITVAGWLHKKRKLGGLNFINLRDRSGLVQILIEDKDEIEKLRGLQIGTVLEIKGEVVEDERAPSGAEIHQPNLTVMVPVVDEPPVEVDKPISHDSSTLDTLFDHRVVTLRNLRETAIFKIQDRVLESCREYFYKNDFTEMKTPKLLAEPTEGGAEVFTLDYFGKTASLAQSAQFYKQIMVGVFERVFEMGSTYRAEPSATTRHMTEFITIDCEMGFVDFDELRQFAHGLLKYVVDRVWQQCEGELKMWNATRPVLPDEQIAMTLAEVHELYTKATGTSTIGEPDLRPDEERWICQYSKDKLGSEALFITDWPASGMKFYHKLKDDDPEIAQRSDFLFRGVEIMTAPMREHRYDKLVEQMKAQGLNPDEEGYQAYLNAFKYGLPPHGGFGLGLERLTQTIIGLNNVKEATLFPRDMNRLNP